MALSSLQLDAFVQIARLGSFSAAAKQLHLTQSALSQRILNLEDELSTSLFLREPAGIRLTERGQRLLRCCLERNSLEEEFLAGLKSADQAQLSGLARIGAFSTLMRSVLLPRLGEFMRAHPRVQMQLFTREVHALPAMLRSGEADFVVCDHPARDQDWVSHLIGEEQYVLIESKTRPGARKHVYLDHDEQDQVTGRFWSLQKKRPARIERAYFDEIYTILDAVEEGLGRAVVPGHLVQGNPRVSVVPGLKPLRSPYYLIYPKQSFYTRLQLRLVEELQKRSGINPRSASRPAPR